MSGLGDGLRALSSDLDSFAVAVEQVMIEGLRAIAAEAVQIIKNEWPVDTGFSRDAWSWEPLENGARIVCSAEYSSFVFAAGDETRAAIYLNVVPDAVARAADIVGLPAALSDVTEEYIGQGRTTSDVTGVSRKFIFHAPASQQVAWRTENPHLIERVTLTWGGTTGEFELVPSDTIPASGLTWSIVPRR